MTDQPASLAEALAQLQTRLPRIKKESQAQYGRYADLADVSRDLLPVMGELGLSFSAKPTWVTREDGNREFVLAYTLRHVSGDTDSGEYPLGQNPTNHQTLGSAITYGRRYCLCAVTGAVADEDDDGQLASAPSAAAAGRRPREAPPTRAAANLPRNRDGSTSRSRTTDDELDATGQMTDAQQREHNKLEKEVKGTGPQGTERLRATPDDDPFYQPAPTLADALKASLRTPQAAPAKRGVIHAHFSRLGKEEPFTDQERYNAMSTITGRRIASTNDLTAAEGMKVADELAKCRDRGQLIERLAVKAGEDIG